VRPENKDFVMNSRGYKLADNFNRSIPGIYIMNSDYRAKTVQQNKKYKRQGRRIIAEGYQNVFAKYFTASNNYSHIAMKHTINQHDIKPQIHKIKLQRIIKTKAIPQKVMINKDIARNTIQDFSKAIDKKIPTKETIIKRSKVTSNEILTKKFHKPIHEKEIRNKTFNSNREAYAAIKNNKKFLNEATQRLPKARNKMNGDMVASVNNKLLGKEKHKLSSRNSRRSRTRLLTTKQAQTRIFDSTSLRKKYKGNLQASANLKEEADCIIHGRKHTKIISKRYAKNILTSKESIKNVTVAITQDSNKKHIIKKECKINEIMQRKQRNVCLNLSGNKNSLQKTHSIQPRSVPLVAKYEMEKLKPRPKIKLNVAECYTFVIVEGNNSQLVRRCFGTRPYWKEVVNSSSAFNFKWQPTDQGINFETLRLLKQKQMINHVEGKEEITTKDGLLKNLLAYCELNKLNAFDITPLTFILDLDSPTYAADLSKFFNCHSIITSTYNEATTCIEQINKKLGKIFFAKNWKASSHSKPKICNTLFAGQNLWVLKPTGLNRGRGITIFNTLDKLKAILKSQEFNIKNDIRTFVIQKYIERPSLIHERKFDIRIWVLITHELKIYFFKEGYLRTSSEIFSIDKSVIGDKNIHLTNNAIQKYSTTYGKFEDGNQLSFNHFQVLHKSIIGIFK